MPLLEKKTLKIFTNFAVPCTDLAEISFLIQLFLIHGLHKTMAQFQKLIKNVILTLHGHNIRGHKTASQQEKASCVFRFEVSRSVITVQCDFRARCKEDAPHQNVFF
jgi:hypothetical protein